MWPQRSLQRGSWCLLIAARFGWRCHLGPQGGWGWFSPDASCQLPPPQGTPWSAGGCNYAHSTHLAGNPGSKEAIEIRLLLLLFNSKCILPFHVSQLPSHQMPASLLQFGSPEGVSKSWGLSEVGGYPQYVSEML